MDSIFAGAGHLGYYERKTARDVHIAFGLVEGITVKNESRLKESRL